MKKRIPSYIPKAARVTSREILCAIAADPELAAAVSAVDVAERFDLWPGDAGARIKHLSAWGCIRRTGGTRQRGRGRPEVLYEVTPHGRRCARTWSK